MKSYTLKYNDMIADTRGRTKGVTTYFHKWFWFRIRACRMPKINKTARHREHTTSIQPPYGIIITTF